ncbi:uncharacterized protein LOC122818519 [Drosophila biarmipes]|uniref:uncharacterized protein LOC122818519 n=1 Tax=Drosophila biarmipes TaxID=125945 RepID=UPI001CDA633E|nr:uncharacterized protein LOC122818519 [Drosophila biarmipes]
MDLYVITYDKDVLGMRVTSTRTEIPYKFIYGVSCMTSDVSPTIPVKKVVLGTEAVAAHNLKSLHQVFFWCGLRKKRAAEGCLSDSRGQADYKAQKETPKICLSLLSPFLRCAGLSASGDSGTQFSAANAVRINNRKTNKQT